jgi:hypothetical protein
VRQDSFELTVPLSAPSNGAPRDVRLLVSKTVLFIDVGTGSYQVQISPDGSAWLDEGSPFTASGKLIIEAECHSVRIRTTAHSSGTPRAILLARNARTT